MPRAEQKPNNAVRDRVTLALAEHRLIFYCQPIKLLAGGTESDPPLMYELLARLTEYDADGHLNIVPAIEWIEDLAAFPELLQQIDRAGILHAIKQQAHAIHAVNLSAETMNDYGFLAFVAENLAPLSVNRDRIHFELTESTALEPASIAVLHQMRGFGFRWIILDDFGKAHHGFEALRAVRPKAIKIDGEYCKALKPLELADEESIIAEAIITGILAMAGKLNLTCVAEMIENGAIATRLLEIHEAIAPHIPLYGQGWEYGKPMPCGGK